MKSLLLVALIFGLAAAQNSFSLSDLFGRPDQGETKCKDATECGPDECCVHMQGAFGKRHIFDDIFSGRFSFDDFFTGVCKPLKKEDEFCVPFSSKLKTTMFNTEAHFATCPCAPGLECTSDKTVEDHPQFGSIETHTNAMCSVPEGSGGEN